MSEASRLSGSLPGSAEALAAEQVDRWLGRLEEFGGKLGLEAMTRLLELLGSPERDVPFVLVAGTNGKGSTSALLSSILAAHLRSVAADRISRGAAGGIGLYTSPHLERPEERLRLDGRAISSADLALLLEEIVPAHEEAFGELPSYFEVMTAAARLHFAKRRCAAAVFEVGLGGRLDATNVGDPILSLVTSISYDHQRHLGSRLEEITGEKAGILRPAVPAVVWGAPPAVLEVLEERARELGSPLVDATREARWQVEGTGAGGGSRVQLTTGRREYDLDLALPGEHQIPNAVLAVLAAEAVAERISGGKPLSRAAVERGVAACRWPGRLEHVEIETDAGPREVVLDGAHNQGGAEALASWLEDRPYDLLFAALERKDVATMLPAVARRARRVVLTRTLGGECHAPESLAELVPEGIPVFVEPDLAAALEAAISALDESSRLVICGSLYLVGDARAALRRRFGAPPRAGDVPIGG